MVLHNRLWFYIIDYVKSIISEIIPGLWTLWTNYEHYEVPTPLMKDVSDNNFKPLVDKIIKYDMSYFITGPGGSDKQLWLTNSKK